MLCPEIQTMREQNTSQSFIHSARYDTFFGLLYFILIAQRRSQGQPEVPLTSVKLILFDFSTPAKSGSALAVT